MDERERELTRHVFQFLVEELAIANGGVNSPEINRMAEFQNPSVSRAATSRPTWTPPLTMVASEVGPTRPHRAGK